MFDYTFMMRALITSVVIAIASGFIGTFVVAKKMSFLAHTLSEIGFAGASFALFLGILPVEGMIIFTVLSAIFVGILGNISHTEFTITAVSSLFIGLGVLFLSLANQSSSSAMSILFGSVLGISESQMYIVSALSLVIIVLIMLQFRKLTFDAYDTVGASSQGLSERWLTVYLLVILALTVSVAAQIVGSLLVFVLITLPASSASYIGRTVWGVIGWSVTFAVVGVVIGLGLSFATDWPATALISFIECGIYFLLLLSRKIKCR